MPRTTDSDPAVRAAPNRLLDRPAPTAPNRVWVGDISYLPRQGGGCLYLAVWLDRGSRKVAGWDVRETVPENLVCETLRPFGVRGRAGKPPRRWRRGPVALPAFYLNRQLSIVTSSANCALWALKALMLRSSSWCSLGSGR